MFQNNQDSHSHDSVYYSHDSVYYAIVVKSVQSLHVHMLVIRIGSYKR